jgi:hypothetical protein
MNSSNPDKKIQRFVPPKWLNKVSIEEARDYIYYQYHVPEPVAKDQLQLVEDEESVVHHNSRAADETAYLQAQINAKRKQKPIQYVSDKKDSIGHTAFLQNQIDLRRKNS